MQIIFKKLLVLSTQQMEVPIDTEFLCIREQFDKIYVWYRCDPSKPKENCTIEVVETAHVLPEGGKYIGTASLSDGFMYHAFVWSNQQNAVLSDK